MTPPRALSIRGQEGPDFRVPRQMIHLRDHARTTKSSHLVISMGGVLQRLALRGQEDPEFNLTRHINVSRGHARTLEFFVLF